MPSGNFRSDRPPNRAKACVLAVAALFGTPAIAAPTAASVVHGQASFAQQGSVLTITNSNGAVINWQGFSIGSGETTRFVQPSSASSVLNRVVGPNPSSILGNLSSNGRVYLINPAGIMVGAGAKIDVAAFVASTLNIRTEDFLANRLNFQPTPGAGAVRNEGIITTPQGGQVYLVAPKVENTGTIVAPGGEVALAAGRSVQIGDTASPGVRIVVDGGESATNLGRVVAEAGRIGMFGALVRNSGSLNASSAVVDGGRILLKATGDTFVDGDAGITATGARGGRVEILGQRVALTDRASVDASGANRGGTVLVGGDYQGGNPDVQNAQVTWAGPQTAIRADATAAGNGGQVVLWSDDTTRAYGSLSARGAGSGDGGRIETSGKHYLDVAGARVDAGSPSGRPGEWLLDPTNVTVVASGADTNVSLAGGVFAPANNNAVSTLTATSINTAINGGTSVTITSGGGGGSGGVGDITFDASGGAISIDKTTNTFASTLRLNAWRNIIFSGGASTFKTTAAAGSVGLTVIMNTGLSGGGGNVFSGSAASVNLLGTATAQVAAIVGNGKTWFNDGAVNLSTNAVLKLNDGSSDSTFFNGGSFNTTNITNNWFILSNPGTQSGIFNNRGVMNVGTGGGSIEAVLNNLSNGVINVLAPVGVSVQNGQNMSGAINLAAGSSMVMSENHGVAATFSDTSIGGNGTLTVSGQNVFLNGVKAGGTTLNLTGGNTTVGSGGTVFGSLVKAAPMTINNGAFGLAGDFAVPSGITYLNDVGLGATGNLIIANGISTAGSIDLAAGGNLRVNGAPVQSSGKSINVLVGGNVIVDSSVGNPRLDAFNRTNLTLLSATSKIILDGVPGSSARIAAFNGPINVDFRNRSDGGIFIDGAPGRGVGAFGSGFFVGNAPALLGSNLLIKYGVANADICRVLPGLCVIRPPNALALVRPLQPKPLDKDDSDGAGEFGDQSGRTKSKRPGVCKAV